MKKYLISFFQLFLTVLILNAQNECLTPSPTPPAWIFSNSAKFTQSAVTSDSRLNIFVHIVRSSNGTGFSTSILQPILSSLNGYYQGVVQFNLLGSDFIDNDIYYIDLTLTEANALFNVGSHCSAIDIYILGASTSFGGAGMAQGISAKAYIVHGSYYDTSTLPHEMGHCLGLYHTHHGTVNEGGGDLSQCAELVNGSNSTTCGDYISDTPADPNVWSINSCSYTGTGVDATGQSYNPTSSNLMSYAFKPCRTDFSAIQIQRIHDFINNTQILQNTLFSTISGPTTLCSSSEAFTIDDLPSGCSVSWAASPSNMFTTTSGSDTSFTTAWNGSLRFTGWGTITATITGSCGSVNITKDVWLGRPTSPTSIEMIPEDGLCKGNQYYYQFGLQHPYDWIIDSWHWDLQPPGIIIGSHTERSVTLYYPSNTTPGTYSIGVSAINSCGESSSHIEYFEVNDCDRDRSLTFNLFPNPASDNVQVDVIQNTSSTNDSVIFAASTDQGVSTNYYVRMINIYGTIVYSTNKKGNSFTLPLAGLRDGTYIISVSDNKNTCQKQLIVKH